MNRFLQRLCDSRPCVMDGAFGTELQKRGLPNGMRPESFCWQHTDILQAIHEDYLRAGAEVILSATFGGSRFKLPPDMLESIGVEAFNCRMAQVARAAIECVGVPAFVAGDMGPSGHFVIPLGDLEPQAVLEAYAEQARGLLQGGVDFFVVETQLDLLEIRLIVAGIRSVSSLPIFAAMTFEEGRSLTGTTPEILVATMANMGVDGVGLNCGAGPEGMLPLVRRFVEAAKGTGLHIFVQPNAGLPELIDDETVYRLPPEPFAKQTAHFIELGASLVGGCCGSSPEHIRQLRACVDVLTLTPPTRSPSNAIYLTTRTELVRIGAGSPVCFIGERINPTGKKALQAALLAGEMALPVQMAAEQLACGVPVLDVNVGAPMVDEQIVLPALVRELSMAYSAPLALDSSNAGAIAAALPYCPGSALINSISGEAGRMETLGPLCRDFGAPCILLPLQGADLPVTAADRIAILERLLVQAENLGIPRRLIMVDVLVLSVASNADAAMACLETIRWCHAQGLPTSVGLSNISFGLPARELINASFLSMAMGAGLSACIVNPMNTRMCDAKAAADVLTGMDTNAATFIAGYADWTSKASTTSTHSANKTTHPTFEAMTLAETVLHGHRDGVESKVQAELDAGQTPLALVNTVLIPAITEVGNRYERREYFLPQLLRAGETMQAAFAYLRPLLEEHIDATAQPVAVLATVEGDIHDIGKNIVGLMLSNHGFTVIDLGKDVKVQTIMDAALEHNADLICLSALMTTTMVRMKDTTDALQHVDCKAKVMIGGAVVTPSFAESIGATYSVDAVDAVRVAKGLLGL